MLGFIKPSFLSAKQDVPKTTPNSNIINKMANMRLLILAILLACMSFASAMTAGQIQRACLRKNRYVLNAINNFCHQHDIVVPGAYAQKGKMSSPPNAHVMISGKYHPKDGSRCGADVFDIGNCKPAQWVPSKYCLAQFHQTCMTGDQFGAGSAQYGRNGCQTWTIYSKFRG